jgi:hypothetical protein
VIGQPNFTTTTLPSTPSSGNISLASSVWMDGTTLWVCDLNFNRVLRYDSATAKGNGGTADGVLGQSSFTTSVNARTRYGLDGPFSVCVDNAGSVYVGDRANLRIMIYKNGAQKANGGGADNLLGSESFTYSQARLDSIGFNGSASIRQLTVDTTHAQLAVADRGSCRVTVFTASGPLTGVSVSEVLPVEPSLEQNYPNPFNPETRIEFRIQKSGFTRLSVHDLLGREVAVLVNEEKMPGTYTVTWDARLHFSNSGGQAGGMTSGVYFCRMQAGEFVQTRKLVLLR